MSLINDALKRASKTDRARARPTETHASLHPAAEPRGRSVGMAIVVVTVVALGSGWFFLQWWNISHRIAPPAEKTVTIVVPAPVVPEVVAPPPKVAVPPPAPAPEPAPPPPPKPVVAAWPAELKLMGIFFSKTNPRAIINGKTVVVGDEIEGIRVSKIERDQVTVEWNGQVKNLVIE